MAPGLGLANVAAASDSNRTTTKCRISTREFVKGDAFDACQCRCKRIDMDCERYELQRSLRETRGVVCQWDKSLESMALHVPDPLYPSM